jgi:putative oxidoreductase
MMFACHGGQKILGFPPGGHGPPSDTLMWVGAIVELVGGLLIAFGFLTRIAAFFAAGEMAVAYFMVHAKMGFFPIVNKGEAAVFYCWFFLFVLFYGAGRWSIDALIGKGKAAAATAT